MTLPSQGYLQTANVLNKLKSTKVSADQIRSAHTTALAKKINLRTNSNTQHSAESKKLHAVIREKLQQISVLANIDFENVEIVEPQATSSWITVSTSTDGMGMCTDSPQFIYGVQPNVCLTVKNVSYKLTADSSMSEIVLSLTFCFVFVI
jgi:hypothetical protein